MPGTARSHTATRPAGNPGFAKRAAGFVNRALGFPLLWIACLAAAALMIVTGGFGTGELPLGQRAGFWLLLMGWNAFKWQLLFALFVRKRQDWPRVSLLGTLLLNLPLPLEIVLAGRAVGVFMVAPAGETWLRALAIGAGIFLVCASVIWVLMRATAPVAAAMPEGGLLARTRTAPEALIAILAEDHYCRVHRRGAASALVHYRFGDALGEVAALEGAQVHRGAWVASGAVQSARRAGRRWMLELDGGTRVPVSASHAAEARRRGWLRAPG